MLGPGGELVVIESDKDYIHDDLIFSIHCIKTNECPVTIQTVSDSIVTFPIGSFVRGAVYHILIRKMIFDENKTGFIGYRLLKTKINS